MALGPDKTRPKFMQVASELFFSLLPLFKNDVSNLRYVSSSLQLELLVAICKLSYATRPVNYNSIAHLSVPQREITEANSVKFCAGYGFCSARRGLFRSSYTNVAIVTAANTARNKVKKLVVQNLTKEYCTLPHAKLLYFCGRALQKCLQNSCWRRAMQQLWRPRDKRSGRLQ